MHYWRFRRIGTTDNPRPTPAQRLLRGLKRDNKTGCLEWQRSCINQGYGEFYANGSRISTHRFAWQLANGPIPDGLFVLHECDNRKCCEISHLFLGDHDANMADMVKKGRQPIGSKNPKAKLTETDIPVIRAKLNNGFTRKHVAKEYGLTPEAIGNIARGDAWRHVE